MEKLPEDSSAERHHFVVDRISATIRKNTPADTTAPNFVLSVLEAALVEALLEIYEPEDAEVGLIQVTEAVRMELRTRAKRSAN